ncbi:uncharacterized protein (TIGR02145 family) [Dysgonomonas sp. PH5-45]|uniref:FISUMP domain-containing protein n=1 Tax=unclassified Dysgonomonas TaxID=2630389 RepID=UPI002472F4D2|nr:MULTISPECIES: FISUMP domain-containing protein [unclassified Dysgonomonas]MDH6354179.1 uncharacterized protein (TIGR02145 family) [Dysgonomonas sp. PH5-45]MDH6386970.1 uncharacterized protein (TIGR02145 family) [Dysgonomonas sp. PH5-37]
MKTNHFLFCFILLIGILSPGPQVLSQVTIGVDKGPHPGALLQIEDGTVISGEPLVNASKGIGLPRVDLQSITGGLARSLNPPGGAARSSDNDKYIGLVVYGGEDNECSRNPLYKGPYIWTGSQWEHLGLSQKSPDLGVLTDNRPQKGGSQKYLYHPFGKAGVWMLDNMRYVDVDETKMTYKVGANSRPDGLANGYYCHPHRAIIEYPAENKIPEYWESTHGYLYNYQAATLGQNLQDVGPTDEHQGYGGDKEYDDEGNPIRVQGICPDGWHIPTDREWSELEEEIYNNPSKYSSYTGAFDPPEWKVDVWNVAGTEARRGTANGDLSKAFSTSCEVIEDNSGKKHPGRSHPVIQGGFNALPVGYITINSSQDAEIWKYGEASTFWTVSKGYFEDFEPWAWTRVIYTSPTTEFDVQRDASDRFNQYSVRCKKDD